MKEKKEPTKDEGEKNMHVIYDGYLREKRDSHEFDGCLLR